MRRSLLLIGVVLLLTTCALAKDEPKFKTIEVRHFPNSEGVELPPEFSDYLYAEMQSTLQKKKLADHLVGEDEVVDAADAPKSAILSGTVLEYKKGSVVKEHLTPYGGIFGAGFRKLVVHVKLVRRSDNQVLIEKDMKVKAQPEWDPKVLARFLANSIAGELKHAE